MHLLDSQDLLVSVGQKGVQPCEINKDIPVCAHTPSNETESRICFNDWEMWLYMQTLSQTAASTTSEFGGGGGGGGASMLRVRDRKTGQFNVFPIVVAGGGGGSAAVLMCLFYPPLTSQFQMEFLQTLRPKIYTHTSLMQR